APPRCRGRVWALRSPSSQGEEGRGEERRRGRAGERRVLIPPGLPTPKKLAGAAGGLLSFRRWSRALGATRFRHEQEDLRADRTFDSRLAGARRVRPGPAIRRVAVELGRRAFGPALAARLRARPARVRARLGRRPPSPPPPSGLHTDHRGAEAAERRWIRRGVGEGTRRDRREREVGR